MKIMKSSKQLFADLLYELQARKSYLPAKMEYPVPYVSQYARAKDVERLVKKDLRAIDDPNWYLAGACSSGEYARWAREICGMAAAKMAIKFFKNKKVLLISLAKEAYKYGVYRDRPGGGISDMRYQEFSTWIEKYGLKAEVRSRLSVRGIQYALAEKKLVIASVSPNIRGHVSSLSRRKGGHLVLMTGYDKNHRTLFLNNPSGFLSLKTQKRHEISDQEFKKYYAGRGILISPA